MKVSVAEKCGFCHGVRNAISVAKKILLEENDVYSFGPIIHNKDVVDRLANSGLKTVNKVKEIHSGTVLIRSHGAAPKQIARLKDKGLNIVDATCILVKRVQHIAGELESSARRILPKSKRLWAVLKMLSSLPTSQTCISCPKMPNWALFARRLKALTTSEGCWAPWQAAPSAS